MIEGAFLALNASVAPTLAEPATSPGQQETRRAGCGP
jgi:hypothetical protein